MSSSTQGPSPVGLLAQADVSALGGPLQLILATIPQEFRARWHSLHAAGVSLSFPGSPAAQDLRQ